MVRNKPFPIPGPNSVHPFTTNSGGRGYGKYLGSDYGIYGHQTPGLVGTATEPDAAGTKYYVGDSGSDSNSGTSKSNPFRTFEPLSAGGSSEAVSGDVIVILEEGVTLNNTSGGFTPGDNNITVSGEDGAFPTVEVNWTEDNSFIDVFAYTGCVFRGFHVNGNGDGSGWRAIRFDNVDPGYTTPLTYQEAREAGWVYNFKATRMGNSAVLFGGNSIGGVIERSHAAYNYGPPASEGTGGGNADGFQFTGGPDEVCIGGRILYCLANHNSDDGIDLYRARGMVIVGNMAYANGYREDGSTDGVEAPGKGIKMGGGEALDIGGSYCARNVSAYNGAAGFGANGSNLPIDFLYNIEFNNSRKDGSGSTPDRRYEKGFEMFESSHTSPSGFQLQYSRLVGNISMEGIYVSLQDGTIDGTNVFSNNFDSNNNFDPQFSNIPFVANDFDDQWYSLNENGLGRIAKGEDANSLPGIIEAGNTSYQPTPASQWHGITDVVDYNGAAPDLGAFETHVDTSVQGEDVTDYGAAGDGTTDDTQAIRDAANAAGPGGTVYFPSGTYLVGSNDTTPLEYPMDGSWDNLTWQGEDWSNTTLLMDGGQTSWHFMYQFDSGGGYQPPGGRWEQLTIDMNGANNQNAPGSHAFEIDDGDGTHVFRDVRFRDSLADMYRTSGCAMIPDVQYCSFYQSGYPSKAAGHAINLNNHTTNTVYIDHCYFEQSAGTEIDIGNDTTDNWQNTEITNCYSVAGVGFCKINSEAINTIIRNCYMEDGGRTQRMIKANSPSGAAVGDVEISDVEINVDGGSGIDFAAAGGHGTITLGTIAMREVDNDGLRTFAGQTGTGMYIGDADIAADTSTISIYNVAPNDDGWAVFFDSECTGTIDQINHSGTSQLGTTNSVTVNTNNAGGPEVTPDVPSQSEVGPR